MWPTFWPPPVSVVVSVCVPDCASLLSAWIVERASTVSPVGGGVVEPPLYQTAT